MLSVNIKITDEDSGWEQLAATLKDIASEKAVVGIQANEDAQLLTIANVQEFGAKIPVTEKMRAFFRGAFNISLKKSTKVINIPSRPFIRQTFDKEQAELIEAGFDLSRLIIDGNIAKPFFFAYCIYDFVRNSIDY